MINIFVDIESGFVDYELKDFYFVEDVLQFYANGKDFNLCFTKPHFFFILYCLDNPNCKKITLIQKDDLKHKPTYAIIMGENKELLKLCKDYGIRIVHFKEKVIL